MRIHPDSLRTIMGKSSEAVIFGLSDCLYLEVCWAINAEDGLKAYIFNDLNDPEEQHIPHTLLFANQLSDKQECKTVITNLLIENYKRHQNGQPIIPLIFCIELEKDGEEVKLDTNSILNRDGIHRSITDAELRRCYKSYAQLGKEMKKISEMTFKFVRVKQESKFNDTYHLVELKPFWKNLKWKFMWHDYTKHKKNNQQLNDKPWRKESRNATNSK